MGAESEGIGDPCFRWPRCSMFLTSVVDVPDLGGRYCQTSVVDVPDLGGQCSRPRWSMFPTSVVDVSDLGGRCFQTSVVDDSRPRWSMFPTSIVINIRFLDLGVRIP